AVHARGERRGELEVRPAVERGEVLPVELEGHGHDRPLRPAGGLGGLVGVAVDALDPGIRKYRHVEAGGLLGPVVEPEERGDSLRDFAHRSLLDFTISSCVGRTVDSGIDNPQVPLDMLPKAAIYTQLPQKRLHDRKEDERLMRYEAPETAESAAALLAGPADARVLPGGTDLLVPIPSRLPAPALI